MCFVQNKWQLNALKVHYTSRVSHAGVMIYLNKKLEIQRSGKRLMNGRNYNNFLAWFTYPTIICLQV